MDKAERDALAAKAEAYLKSFPSPEAVAEQFETTVDKVHKWIHLKRYPQSVFIAMQQPTETTAAPSEQGPQDATAEDAGKPSGLEDAHVKIDNLHQRLQRMEDLVGLLSEQQDGVQEQIAQFALAGSKLDDNSGVRPGHATRVVQPRGPRTAENSVVIGSRIVTRGAVGDGIAPTREEANGSMSAGRGKLAGPAEQREPIKPGQPGWDGPDPRTGQGGWNSPKPKLMMVPARSWPVSR